MNERDYFFAALTCINSLFKDILFMKKIFIGLGVIVIVLIVGVIAVGIRPELLSIPLLHLRFPESEFPQLYRTASFQDISADPLPQVDASYSAFGIRFDSSFGEAGIKKPAESLTAFIFRDDKELLFFKNEITPQMITSFLEDAKPDDVIILKKLFGEDVLSDEFSFISAVLKANMSDINIFSTKEKVVATSALLITKAIYDPSVFHSEARIIIFKAKKTKGFIYSEKNATTGITSIRITYFDSNNAARSLFANNFTLQEIESVINSIRFE